MNRALQTLRLTPQAAGALQKQCTKATTELLELTRFRKEFDRQRRPTQTEQKHQNALLLAALVKEAA